MAWLCLFHKQAKVKCDPCREAKQSISGEMQPASHCSALLQNQEQGFSLAMDSL